MRVVVYYFQHLESLYSRGFSEYNRVRLRRNISCSTLEKWILGDNLRLLIAEDHEICRIGLRLAINAEADMELIHEAANGEGLAEKIIELVPDIAILDISMPYQDGLSVTQMIKPVVPQVKVLICSAHGDRETVLRAMSAGADGYILKGASLVEVIKATRTICSGTQFIDPLAVRG